MRWNLRQANLLYRHPDQDQGAEALLVGDIYEFTDPPVCEVDRSTRKCSSALQCFRVMDADLTLKPVARDSWLS